jgi:hypothetical protein
MYAYSNPQTRQISKYRRKPPFTNIFNIASTGAISESYNLFTTISYSNSPYKPCSIPMLKSYEHSPINAGAIRFRQSLRRNVDFKKKLYKNNTHSNSSPKLRSQSPVASSELSEDPIIVVNKKTLNQLPPLKIRSKFSLKNSRSTDGLKKKQKYRIKYEVGS